MKLYFSPGACSLAAHIVLEEAGAKYELVKLSLRDGDQRKPEYLQKNPKAKVPLLELDDGQFVTENPAIQSYVADTFPQAGLLPPVGDLQRIRAQEWLAWCASGVQPAFGLLFGSKRLVDGEEAQKSLFEKGVQNLQAQLDAFDRGLTGKSFVLGDRFSAADSYTLVFYNWAKNFPVKTGPAHNASAEKLLARPAIQRVFAAEGLPMAEAKA
jgi:glutathione S-transferase